MKIFTNNAITEQIKMFKVMFLLKQNQLKKKNNPKQNKSSLKNPLKTYTRGVPAKAKWRKEYIPDIWDKEYIMRKLTAGKSDKIRLRN